MDKILKISMIASLSLLCGCFSLDIAKNPALAGSTIPDSGQGAPIEHIVVSNYGWYLFHSIPLVCGNADVRHLFPWIFFENHVDANKLHDRIMLHAAAKNADMRELMFFRNEKVMFDVPGTNFPIPIPYVLCYREIQFSGVLVEKKEPEFKKTGPANDTITEMNRLLDNLSPEETK